MWFFLNNNFGKNATFLVFLAKKAFRGQPIFANILQPKFSIDQRKNATISAQKCTVRQQRRLSGFDDLVEQ